MPTPVYGYQITAHGTHTEVTYDRASGGYGRVLVYPDTVMVDGVSYEKRHITNIYVKVPAIVEEHARHRPRPPRGIFASIGFAAGAAVKQRQVDNANRSEWSVWLNYGEKPLRLAWGVDEHRAAALQRELHKLIFRAS